MMIGMEKKKELSIHKKKEKGEKSFNPAVFF